MVEYIVLYFFHLIYPEDVFILVHEIICINYIIFHCIHVS